MKLFIFSALFLILSLVVMCIVSLRRRIAQTLKRAQQGAPQSQYEAALLYYRGKYGVKKDWIRTFDYLYSAAQTGHIKALNNLGALYCAGHGTKKNLDKALVCYRQAAEQGDFEGMINLAVLYHLQKDDTQAFAWMKKAADGGSPLGQRMLAEFYYAGIGTEPDKQTGLRYYMLAAKQGEPNAIAFLKTRDPRLQHHGPM